jgi:hypothetical protein
MNLDEQRTFLRNQIIQRAERNKINRQIHGSQVCTEELRTEQKAEVTYIYKVAKPLLH